MVWAIGWGFVIWGIGVSVVSRVVPVAGQTGGSALASSATWRLRRLTPHAIRTAFRAAPGQPQPAAPVVPSCLAGNRNRPNTLSGGRILPLKHRGARGDIPADLRYTAEHEGSGSTGTDTVRVGITDFAQSSLGDVVYVQLPEVGIKLNAGEAFGEVESTKSVSDLYAPVSATVVAVNDELVGNPQLVNPIPMGRAGSWNSKPAAIPFEAGIAALLDADAYRATLTCCRCGAPVVGVGWTARVTLASEGVVGGGETIGN